MVANNLHKVEYPIFGMIIIKCSLLKTPFFLNQECRGSDTSTETSAGIRLVCNLNWPGKPAQQLEEHEILKRDNKNNI